MKDHVLLSATLAMIATLFLSSVFPHLHLMTLAPFLVILYLNLKPISALWCSTLTGLFSDLFSSHLFGMYALLFALTSALLYRQKRFFNEKPINLAIFTALVSLLLSLMQPLFLFLFEKGVALSGRWILTDLLLLPLLDGLYALIWFSLPLQLYDYLKKQMRIFKLRKETKR